MDPSLASLARSRGAPPRFRLVAVGLSLSLMALASGCFLKGNAKDSDPKDEREPERIPVEVVALRRGPIESTLKTSTHLEAEEDVKVFSRASNLVRELLVEEGDRVLKGDLMLRLEDDAQRTQWAKAKSQLEKAQQEFARQEALHAEDLISDQAFADAKFNLRQLELSLEEAQRQLDYTQVRAPIQGSVTARLVNLGDHVTANQHLFDIIDFDSIVARVHIPELNLADLEPGDRARLTSTAYPGQTMEGVVKRISPVVDDKTGTVKATIGLKEIGPLRPGMYVEVEVVLATDPNALLIPNEAIAMDGSQRFVYRLLPDRKVERVPVEPKIQDRFHLQPTSGFEEGDQVVAAGKAGLKDGARVRLPDDPKPSKPAEKP